MKFNVNLGGRTRLLACVAAAALAVNSTPASASTVITGARMLDVLTGKTVEYPAIFVDDNGRITAWR